MGGGGEGFKIQVRKGLIEDVIFEPRYEEGKIASRMDL